MEGKKKGTRDARRETASRSRPREQQSRRSPPPPPPPPPPRRMPAPSPSSRSAGRNHAPCNRLTQLAASAAGHPWRALLVSAANRRLSPRGRDIYLSIYVHTYLIFSNRRCRRALPSSVRVSEIERWEVHVFLRVRTGLCVRLPIEWRLRTHSCAVVSIPFHSHSIIYFSYWFLSVFFY